MRAASKTWIVGALATSGVVAALVWSQSKRTVRLTASQVQVELGKKFPVEKSESVYRIR